MLVEPCVDAGCDCYTCYQCSACQRPYCLSHMHPIYLAPGISVTLCKVCFQQADDVMQVALDAWNNQSENLA
jgi:hypothetical protein